MQSRAATTAATYALLSLAGGISFMLPDTLSVPDSAATPAGAPVPETVELTGIIRDFPKAHADFDTMPAEGPGHYAGNINRWLPGYQRPLFVGGGFKVDGQWRDSSSRPIAPHLAGVSGGTGETDTLGIRVADQVEVKKDCQIDSFNSNRGLYGIMGNFGAAAYVATNSTAKDKIKVDKNAALFGDAFCGPGGNPGTAISGLVTGNKAALDETYDMPDIAVPEDLGPDLGDVTISGGLTVWTGNVAVGDELPAMLFEDLVIKDSAVVNVVGDVRVVCTSLKIEKKSEIDVTAGANLTFYVIGNQDTQIKDECLVNTADVDTGLVTINHLGTKKVKVEKKSHVYATIVTPQADLEVKDEAHVYGAFVGQSLKLDKKSMFHVDAANGDMGVYNPAILVRDKFEIEDKTNVDSWDSNEGPYDGPDDGGTNWDREALVQTNSTKSDKVVVKGNCELMGDVLVGTGGDPDKVIKEDGTITGSKGTLATPLPIPVVAPPPMGPLTTDKLEYKNGAFVLNSNVRCKEFKMEDATLEIDGDVIIRCDKKTEIKKKSEITLRPNSTLTLYVQEEVKMEDRAKVNVGGNAQHVQLRRMSLGKKGKIEIKDRSELCAWVQGAKTEMTIDDRSHLYGSFMGEKLKAKKDSWVHVDMAYLTSCVDFNDTAGTAGATSTGGITSAATFDEWFKDVLGVNQSQVHTITLTKTGEVYEYLDDAFHPVDDMLLGNEGEPYNHNFTYELKVKFTYAECGGQWVELSGGDGIWMFVNGNLAIDLGGVNANQPQHVEIDRLGLEDGEAYPIHIFYAQRRKDAGSTAFRLRTNLELTTDGVIPGALASFD